MAITKISVLNTDGTWATPTPIGVDGNEVTLKSVTSPALGNNTFNTLKVVSSDTATTAWRKFNQVCDAATQLSTNTNTSITGINTKINGLSTSITTMSASITTMSASITTMSASIANMNTSITNINNSITTNMPQTHVITIASTAWGNSAYTYTNAFFQSGNYAYWVSPIGTNMNGVYAENVTVASKITFKCLATPTSPVTINVIKMKTS